MKVVVLDVCKKEMAHFPKEILGEFVDAVALLDEGIILNMPLSKAMPSIGKNVHELRLKDKDGIYRIFYVIKKKGCYLRSPCFSKENSKNSQEKY
ncbi:MAG: type II toxin-antitoxin system RelE/ParE family toxin [Bacteriovoracaceae bacterium]|nr:type II toxin-antitoxin system RelE/ParE family toxin [Bacteriovoracaceae bacterium]